MKKLAFGLVATVLFSLTAAANNTEVVNPVQKEVRTYVLDGKSYSSEEFSKLGAEHFEVARPCTVTTTVTVQTPAGPETFSETVTFDASIVGCLLAKAAAFIAGLWNPSV
ncbi:MULTISPECIES: hypothetical protein [Flavobacterium]|uniref:Uncharacterized protein n=1 Tax=Flavobacterium jumunjinense TaxID=998845 RepID=A0ABV5GQ86_9FLAO|nr:MULTISPECIES: hypothetical protein [Flavobacterium]